nr:hypothetical protein [uncultured Albidiferax sp.]
MTFINEYISVEDKKRHNMTPDSNYYLAGTASWTVDKKRDMFLLPRTGLGPESEPGLRSWAFYWHGHLLDVRLKSIDSGGDASGTHGWGHTRLLDIGDMPPELQAQRVQIVADLKEALTAHKGLGVYSTYTSFEVTLDTE